MTRRPCRRSQRPGARRVGADPAPRGADRGGWSAASRSEHESLLDVPLEAGPPADGRGSRPAGRGAVPADPRARLRGPRRRHPAGRDRRRDRARGHGRRPARRCCRTRRSSSPTAGLRHRRRRVRQDRRPDHPRRDRQGRGRQPRHRPPLPGDRRRLGRRQGADRLPAAARARARRLLDVLRLHRRSLPRRRQPGAARQRARRRRPDEPDQRHVPGRAAERPTSRRGCWTSSPTRRRSTSSSWSSTRSSR